LVNGPENELLRRIESHEKAERMPLEGPRLSDAEMAILRRWLAAGAPWAKDAAGQIHAGDIPPEEPFYFRLLAWWERHELDRLKPALYAALFVLLGVLLVERARERAARATAESARASRLARVPRIAYVAAILGLVVFGLALYTRGVHADLSAARRQLAQREERKADGRATPSAAYASYEIGQPYFPKHPPRLGGTYYRGNDERNIELYNGGFYRTATLELDLRDADDRKLAVGDAVAGPLVVRLEIRRAPHATEQLFQDSALTQACLSPIEPDGNSFRGYGETHFFEIVEPGACWEARAPLPAISPGEPLSGELFVYQGSKQQNGRYTGNAHYQVEYRLVLDAEGRLAADSTLHLGSCYNVSQVIKVPEGRITPEEWFDFRPLPEIVGGNTSDPKLLGVDEHERRGDSNDNHESNESNQSDE
jgi:hypothetical protein